MNWHHQKERGHLDKGYINIFDISVHLFSLTYCTGLTHCDPTSRPSPSSCSSPVEPGTNPQRRGQPELPPAQTHSTPTHLFQFSHTDNGLGVVSDQALIKVTHQRKKTTAPKRYAFECKFDLKITFVWNHYNPCFSATDMNINYAHSAKKSAEHVRCILEEPWIFQTDAN